MIANYQEFYYRSADNLKLYCRIYDTPRAAATTILCLPGLTRNSSDFDELANHLRINYRVLALDLRGRGRSDYDSHWQNYQPLIYLADIAALLEALNISRTLIIGTSLGALLAMVFAAQNPSKVDGLILNDAGPEINPVGAARIAKYVGVQHSVDSWEQAAAQGRQTYGHALPGLTDAQWLSYTRQAYRENAQGKPIPDMDPNIGELFRSGAATPQNLWPIFAQLRTVPTLVIRGATSDILSAATLQRMAQEKPDLQQLTVANRGHAPLLNEPECVASIDSFLASIRH